MDGSVLIRDPADAQYVVLLTPPTQPRLLVSGFPGANGKDGQGFALSGSVATYADLPTTLTADDKGQAWLVNADHLVYTWSGTAWPAEGTGADIQGPPGADGPANTLTIGTVTTLAAGSPATAQITGIAPNQTLDLGIPAGQDGEGSGTVSSVGLSLPPSVFNVTTPPITESGTLTADFVAQAANTVFAGPANGADAAPGFRALVASDIPSLDWSQIGSGTPTTLAGYGITDAATAAQGAKADTALQPSQEGIANGLATLGSDGKLDTSQIPTALLGQLDYQGTWDASAGTAPSAAPAKGQYWMVSVAGSTDVGGFTDWQVGDWAVYGTSWQKVDNTDAVVSVAGLTGPISGASLKAALALDQVDNTADADKPISTATATALAGKEPSIAAGTPAQYRRGDKTWADFATDVRAAVLTGLSTATNAAIAAADSVLVALGKLQAQISANATAIAGKAGLALANVFTNQQAVTPYRANITGAVSIDLAATAKSNKLILTLTGNVTSFALTNAVDGASYSITFLQDATGGRTLPNPLGTAFKFSGGTQPTWTTTASARDKLVLDYDATAALFECAQLAAFA